MTNEGAEPARARTIRERAGRLWLQLMAGVGVVSAFNLLASIDALFQMSASVEWLNKWWRYLVSWPFDFLELPVNPLGQDILVLLSMAFSAGSLGLYLRFGRSIFSSSIPELLWNETRDRRRRLPSLFVMVAVMAGGFLLALYGIDGDQALVHALFAGFIALTVSGVVISRSRLRDRPGRYAVVLRIAQVLAYPFEIYARVVGGISLAPRAVAWSAGLVALLLGLNWLFDTVVDPLEPLLRNLPTPPA